VIIAPVIFTAFAAADDTFILRGATVHPVTSPAVDNATLIVRDGKIVSLATGKTALPKGLKLIDGKGLHVWPGMINCATQMGIAEVSSVRDVNDANEIGEFVPQVRAIVAVNAGSDHIPVTRVNGITSVLTLPASLGGGRGASGTSPIIRGQAALLRLDGWTWEEMEINRSAGMMLRWPVITTRSFSLAEGASTIPYTEAKRVYDDDKRKIEEFFEAARRYQRAKANPAAGFKNEAALEAMLPVLEGKVPLLVAAERERTIREVIEFADKQNLRLILMDVKKPGAALRTIAEKKIPVVVGKTTEAPLDEDDAYDAPITLPDQLRQAGVKFAFATYDNQFARNLPYEAAYAVAYGLPHDDAMKALTIHAAEIFGSAAQTGSIEPGKWADLMVTDGDPLEVRTQVKMLFIQGRNVPLETRHTRLYQKYMSRP
jgi:imidazolonepropionase-like amidohydrolase